jgi:hypothetical protein
MPNTIESALENLLGVCDGAHSQDGTGFNGYDAPFAKDLWAKRPWTIKQQAALYKMLRKYTKQLSGFGVDYAAIPVPLIDAPPAPSASPTPAPLKPWSAIELVGETKVEVRFPYNPDIVEMIREVSGRSWNPQAKCWSIDLTNPLALDDLFGFAVKAKMEMPQVLQSRRAEATAKRKEVEEQSAKAVASSLATDAEIEVAGLGGILMPFQRAGVAYASEKRRSLIADEMGLGKTVQALATIKNLNAFPVIIFCPASLKLNWYREARKWLPGHSVALFEDAKGADVSICNYEQLVKFKDYLTEVCKHRGLVFDEMHYLKNYKAQRSIAAKELADAVYKKFKKDALILGLTGTPILNRPGELLHLLQILHRLEDIGGFQKFRSRYMWGQGLEELQQICRSTFLIRREKSQVLKDLPAKRRVDVGIAMEDPEAYHALENSTLPGLTEADALVRIGELRREAARQKVPGIIQWIKEFQENEKKLVLFTVHKEVQAAYMNAFPGCAAVLGDMEIQDRQKAVDRFQEDPACNLIVCSLKAAGVGLTLTASSDVAFAEFGWTPGDMDQAEDRCHRIGQKDSVTAWYLEGNGAGIDEKMLALIEEKREHGDRLLNVERIGSEHKEAAKGQLVKAILRNAKIAAGLL